MHGKFQYCIQSAITTIFFESLEETLDSLKAEFESTPHVTYRIRHIVSMQLLLKEFVDCLAEAASLNWPDWYDRTLCTELKGLSKIVEINDLASIVKNRRIPGWSETWFKQALKRFVVDKTFLTNDENLTEQAKQLTIALSGQGLIIILSLENSKSTDEQLLIWARGIEWLHAQTHVSIINLLPVEFNRKTAIDSITFNSIIDQPSNVELDQIELLNNPGTLVASRSQVVIKEIKSTASKENKELFGPIIGRPHPGSPGECRLAEFLAMDQELKGLFEFNQYAQTELHSTYLVDLIWKNGRVIIEVDGFRWHSSVERYTKDRLRDYELMVSNFSVLRIPHDVVMSDINSAIEQIRRVVHYRRSLNLKLK